MVLIPKGVIFVLSHLVWDKDFAYSISNWDTNENICVVKNNILVNRFDMKTFDLLP